MNKSPVNGDHLVAVPGSHKVSVLDQMFWEDRMISLHSVMSCSVPQPGKAS